MLSSQKSLTTNPSIIKANTIENTYINNNKIYANQVFEEGDNKIGITSKIEYTSINLVESNIQESSINILKNKKIESNYGDLDINKDYFFGCPICKSMDVEIKKYIYNKEDNDYKIFFTCGSSENLFSDLLSKFFILNKYDNIYLSEQNAKMIKKILEENIYGFNGYPFLKKIYEKYSNTIFEEKEKISIISDNFSLYDDINNPIKKIFWIDENINSEENKKYLMILNKLFKNIETFEDEQSLFEIIQKSKFDIYIIIVNGKNFDNYLNYVLNNSIYGIPVCAIFTRNELELKGQIKKEYKNYLNDKFYNPLGISTTIENLIEKIKKFITDYVQQINNINLGFSNTPKDYKYCFIFEFIDDDYKLIFPYLYKNILQNTKISTKDIRQTNLFILENYGGDQSIKNLIVPLLNVENIPSEIIGKFWGRIYTMESPFYKNLNNNLMKLDNAHYNEYIQMLYKGLKEFEYKDNDILYRGTNISNEEIENILNFYKNRKNDDGYKASYLIYSRAFISFSKDKNVSLGFIQDIKNTKKILFQLKNSCNIKNLSNAYLYNISYYPKEYEVLFFPFSTFIIENIINENDIYYISLEYLGRYEQRIKSKIKTVDKNIMKKIISQTNFSKDTVKLNIIPKEIENNKEINIDLKENNIINSIIDYNNEVNLNNINSEINCIYKGFENIIDLLYNDISKINPEINESNIEIFVNEDKIKFNYKYVNNMKGEIKVKFKFKKLIENISYLFYNCSALKAVDLSSFYSNKINDMSYMFSGCYSLESINLISFKSNQLKNLSYMFSGCYSLKSIDLSSINANEVKNIEGLFNNCFSLKSVKLPKFNPKEIKDVSIMFNGCSSLNERNIIFTK